MSHCISGETPVVPYKLVCRRCLYCSLSLQNLTRHILAVHVVEPEVKEIMDGCLSDLDRRRAFARLRNKGIIVQNRELVIAGKLDFSVILKTAKVVHCRNCNGSYSQNYFYRHRRVRRQCHPTEAPSQKAVRASPPKVQEHPLFIDILGDFQ